MSATSLSYNNRITMHYDVYKGMKPNISFLRSLKPKVHSPSTLLNAGATTNFTYRVVGAELQESDIERINAMLNSHGSIDILGRIRAIGELGASLQFEKVDNPIFRSNLSMLDCCLPKILAHMLLQSCTTGAGSIEELTRQVADCDMTNSGTTGNVAYYAYKMKHLLVSVALGMTPGTPWNGRFEANGGYLVVKRDGDVLCYHFYDRNNFQEYLYQGTYLERASATRYNYAKLYRDELGNLCFKLNLQIRLR